METIGIKHRIFAISWLTYAGYDLRPKIRSRILPLLLGERLLIALLLANVVFGCSLSYPL